MSEIKLRTDNISIIHQHDLMDKFKIASHPTVNDIVTAALIQKEIERRKHIGSWNDTINY